MMVSITGYNCCPFCKKCIHIFDSISIKTVIMGISKAMVDAKKKWGITSKLILSILLHFSVDDAIETLKKAAPFRKYFFAIGLNSSRLNHSSLKFKKLVNVLYKSGFTIMSHVGDNQSSTNVKEALELFHCSRIDYGKSTVVDSEIVSELVKNQIPLTLSPLNNFTVHGRSRFEDNPLKKMMNLGMLVTVNSEYPAFCGSHLNCTYLRLAEALSLKKKDIVQLAVNSFKASFLTEVEKQKNIALLTAFANA